MRARGAAVEPISTLPSGAIATWSRDQQARLAGVLGEHRGGVTIMQLGGGLETLGELGEPLVEHAAELIAGVPHV